MPKAAPGLRYRCKVINPPSRITDRCGVKVATASALEAASTAHTAKAITRAATVYRRDPITQAATTPCYGPTPRLTVSHAVCPSATTWNVAGHEAVRNTAALG